MSSLISALRSWASRPISRRLTCGRSAKRCAIRVRIVQPQAVDRLAGYAEQAGSYLRDTEADSMLSDAEDFGRRKPAAVAAGALALGLVASRFLKASSSRRYSARQSRQSLRVPSWHNGGRCDAGDDRAAAGDAEPAASAAGRDLVMATGDTPPRTVTRDPERNLREESMGALFKQLSDELSTLVRQELRLAQAEMTEKGKKAGLGLGMFGGAGVIAFLALQALTACLVALLATAMDVWIAALIITVVYAAGAGVLALTGKKQVSEATPPVPEQTAETLKEDVQWAKTQLPSGKK